MAEGGEVRLPDPGEHLGRGGVAGQIGAQHQHVDEEPDGVLDAAVPGAPGHRGADRQVLVRTGPHQHGGQRGVQGHEERGTPGAGRFDHPGVGRRVEPPDHHLCGRAGCGGASGAAGQQHTTGRQPVQLLAPVSELTGGQRMRIGSGAEPVELVTGVLRVRDGERGSTAVSAPRTRAS